MSNPSFNNLIAGLRTAIFQKLELYFKSNQQSFYSAEWHSRNGMKNIEDDLSIFDDFFDEAGYEINCITNTGYILGDELDGTHLLDFIEEIELSTDVLANLCDELYTHYPLEHNGNS